MRSLGLLLAAPLAAHAGCTVGTVTCYVDDSSRILGNPVIQGNVSPEYCAQICADRKLPLAGVENGNQCMCGGTVKGGAKATASGDCNTDCSWSSSGKKAKCGGNWRIGVFNVSCSGAPEPAPPRPAGRLVNPCLDASGPYASQKWCDAKLSISERVTDMISRMTVSEKICSLDSGACAIGSLGLPGYNWWSEATHGISHVKNDEVTPYETNFAFPITTGMSWNRSLWFATGQAIGIEARAFMNAGNAYSTYWAPVVNLAREPRWGRNIETPGEDPVQSGEYAAAFVQGFERNPIDTEHIMASACCKHYAVNSMESSTVAGVHWDRNHFDATVTQQDLDDSYLVPFQSCVEKGNVSGLMCSYNAINGVPSCASDYLLKDTARAKWGFDGYVTSDCDADNDVFRSHHYLSHTAEEVVRDVLRAGTDIDCGSFVGKNAQSALDKGTITEKDLDDRLALAFRVRMRLSHFDPEGPLNKIPPSAACSPESQAVAREGTAQSAALLKNEGGTLPLDASKLSKVAVIGPNAENSKSVAGYYGGNSCDNKYMTMTDAVSQYVSGATYVQGVPSVTSTDTSKIADAVAAAKAADAVVLFIGCDLSCGREGHDATTISLSAAQQQLVDQVADAASGKPVVVVTLTHIPLDISAILKNSKVGAVMHVGQPSVQTLGVGDVLFGKRSPAGRTIQTVYPASYADQVSIFDFNMRPGPSVWPRPDCPSPYKNCQNGTNPGRTHKFYNGDAVVKYGTGLHYTTFGYQVATSPQRVSLGGLQRHLADGARGGGGVVASHTVSVSNTGGVDSDEVVLVFVVPPGAGVDGVPLQTLVDFQRVHVKAGETATVRFDSQAMHFSQVDSTGKRYALAGEYTMRFGVEGPGMASAETKLYATL